MAETDLAALTADLGEGIQQIEGLHDLDQADVERLQGLFQQALTQQKQQVEQASEQALTHVPALLRKAVRKLLFR